MLEDSPNSYDVDPTDIAKINLNGDTGTLTQKKKGKSRNYRRRSSAHRDISQELKSGG